MAQIINAGIYGFVAYMLSIVIKFPSVVVIAAMIGISQVQLGIDTTKVQNDIFELKEILKNKKDE